MGCDIHLNVQVRSGPEAPWVTVQPFVPCEYCDGTSKTVKAYHNEKVGDPCSWCNDGPNGESTGNGGNYHRRNYALFALLADVRNSDGSDRITPLAEPRELPEDLEHLFGDYNAQEAAGLDIGDHSVSWFMVSELLAYDWDQPCPREYSDGPVTMRAIGDEFLAFLDVLNALGSPEHTRIVFGFDN